MALLAEELVEEWLNRSGYFTIRGIKLGVHEVDLLAIKHTPQGVVCRHIEVQASMRPVSYITRVPKNVQKETGRAATSSARRDGDELLQGVIEWIDKKFHHPRKIQIKKQLWPAEWSKELVVNNVKSDEELSLIASQGITIHRLNDLLSQMNSGSSYTAAGADFYDLVQMGSASD
jgi:hypothetical protein